MSECIWEYICAATRQALQTDTNNVSKHNNYNNALKQINIMEGVA